MMEGYLRRMGLLIVLTIAVGLAGATGAAGVTLNEWVSNDIGSDDHEFIELLGEPATSLDGYSVALIEGEGTGAGTIDRVIDLTGYSIGASGFFVIGDPLVSPDLEMSTGFIENGGNNIILVQDILQAQGTDIDTDDDGVEDLPIGTVVDAVGYGSVGDHITYYGAVPVGPDGSYDPAGGAVCYSVWEMICLNGTEASGPGCALPDYEVGYATPGAINDCLQPTATDDASWGTIKALYK
jgi:hypothetical protein